MFQVTRSTCMLVTVLLSVADGHLRQQSARSPDEREAQVQINRAPGSQTEVAMSSAEERNTAHASMSDPLQAPEPASVKRDTEDNQTMRSYIMQTMHCTREGIGRMVTRTKPIVDFAVSNGLSVVCQPEYFGTDMHSTGNLGYLFGCVSDTEATGQFISLKHVRNDKSLIWEPVTMRKAKGKSLYRLNASLQDHRVYKVVGPSNAPCPWEDRWGKSARFYRSQYHLVRKKDPKRIQTLSGFNIVVMVRRGDLEHSINKGMFFGHYLGGGSEGFPPESYVDCIEALHRIRGVMNHNNVHISVLAEEAPDTRDASELKQNFTAFQKKYNLPGSRMRFYFGAPEKEDEKGRQRFVRDLDMISLADVLVLSSGHFSSLGAALQMNGIAFSIRKSGNLGDLPNHIANYSSSSDSGYDNWPVPISASAELAPFRLP